MLIRNSLAGLKNISPRLKGGLKYGRGLTLAVTHSGATGLRPGLLLKEDGLSSLNFAQVEEYEKHTMSQISPTALKGSQGRNHFASGLKSEKMHLEEGEEVSSQHEKAIAEMSVGVPTRERSARNSEAGGDPTSAPSREAKASI